MFSRITIEEEGRSSPEDILVLRWRNVRKFLSVRDQTFYIWTEEDLNTMDLDTNLFRCRERLSKVNKKHFDVPARLEKSLRSVCAVLRRSPTGAGDWPTR